MTGQARKALEEAEVITGYTRYLSLIRPLLQGKETVSTGMTGEVQRAQGAVDMARSGKKVAIVSSGDPGVYGMAGLVMELAAPHDMTVEVIPGITAASAAASLLGAPLMHDFAVISLSDLLTPWGVIEKRLEGAAAADFVVVLYNPASKKRRGHLEKARQIMLRYREKTTPVGLARNSYREGQEVQVTDLEKLPGSPVDMFTTVIIGNSQTFIQGNRLVTPRGYPLKGGGPC